MRSETIDVIMPSLKFGFAGLLAVATLFAQNPLKPGQLPGAYTPLSTAEKLKFRFINTVALRGLTGAAFGAAGEQVINSPREWGKGIEGYGKRYASTLGGAVARQTLNFGLESALHEDPRYFPLDNGSTKARIMNALKQTFLARTDSGKTTLAYGRIAAAFATGQIVRSWLPPSVNGTADGFRFGGVSLGVDGVVNLLYEFVPSSRPKEINKP